MMPRNISAFSFVSTFVGGGAWVHAATSPHSRATFASTVCMITACASLRIAFHIV